LIDLNIDFDKHEIIRWVQMCQNGDGGFGFYPETKTSYMENIFCALEILSKLDSYPMRVDLCREYILGCQTKGGGFGRAPMSFPFIESTYQAVTGLFMLESMGRSKT
jgi:prenyltransferase beta subunit